MRKRAFPPFLQRTNGASLIEYGVIVGLVSIVAIAAVISSGEEIKSTFDGSSAQLASSRGSVSTPSSPSGPSGPYDGYLDPDTFLMGTPAADSLNLITNSGYLGAYGLASNDTIRGSSAHEILIGGKGNDYINSDMGGDDTIVYASGDGSDEIREYLGNDTLVFPDISSDGVVFVAASGGNDLEIQLPDGSDVTVDAAFITPTFGIERIEFSDGVSYNVSEQITKAGDDAKPSGTVYRTPSDDIFYHTASTDGSYELKGQIAGDDTLVFTETSYADARFRIPNSVGSSLMILTPDGDEVEVNMQAYYSHPTMETIRFADGYEPTLREQLDRAAEDAKSLGTDIFSTPNDDNFFHTVATDPSSWIKGNYNGNDVLTFTDLSYSNAAFSNIGSALVITTTDGDTVRLDGYFNHNPARRIEIINFTDYTPSQAEITARISSGG